MKRMFRVVSCLFALGLVAGSAAAQTAPAQGRRTRVAVLDFDYSTVRSSAAAIFGSDLDIGRGVADLLITDLVKDGSFSVIERAALNQVLAEQNFSNSDRADPTSAAKLGKLLGVDAIIVGSITQFGNDTRTTNIGGVGSRFGTGALGGVGRRNSKAIVGLNARIVSIDTAEILAVAEGKGESKRSSTSLLGGGGSWGGFGAGGVNFGSSDFQNTIIGEAVKAATDQLAVGVVDGKNRIMTREISVEGLIAAVESGVIVLNVGGRAGLKVGTQLTVERVSREIKDPATGRVIRRLASQVGTLKVTDVDDESALASIVTGTGFKVGDAVKTVVQ
ncbi:MAG: CsgG/HfaB family protein [Vicinamibacterales bacterium]